MQSLAPGPFPTGGVLSYMACNRPFAEHSHMIFSIIKIVGTANGRSVMKFVRLPILRLYSGLKDFLKIEGLCISRLKISSLNLTNFITLALSSSGNNFELLPVPIFMTDQVIPRSTIFFGIRHKVTSATTAPSANLAIFPVENFIVLWYTDL